MIGLDSNIIIRAITGDDPIQSPSARSFLATLSAERPGVINSVVLVELAWTLRVRHKYPKREILEQIENLLRSSAFYLVDRDAVSGALVVSQQHAIDFADALIGEINRRVGCDTTMTFDQQAARVRSFSPLQ